MLVWATGYSEDSL